MVIPLIRCKRGDYRPIVASATPFYRGNPWISKPANPKILNTPCISRHFTTMNPYLTSTGYAILAKELTQLMTVERPQVVEVVSWAAGNGDRSENGDYLYGKKRLREIDRRMGFLTQLLTTAVVVDPSAQANRDRVYFGATVTYENEAGQSFTVSIVGAEEAEPSAGKISFRSPLAVALLKKKSGDVSLVITPEGKQEIEIVAIDYN
jgi:transcription elongation factor GreB